MNYSDYTLHGISPFYDQTVFVRCHLCRNTVKLPQLADHLDQRHNNTTNNDSNETELTTNETLNSKVLNNQNSTSVNYNNNNNSNITNNKKARNNTKTSLQLDTTQLSANESITKPKTLNIKIKNKNKLTTKIPEQFDLTIQTAEQPKINQVVEKIKSKIISAKKLTEQQQTNNDYKSLPKLIIKKDKNSANNECFYLNNVQTSSQQQPFHYIETQQSNNLQTVDIFRHNSSNQSSLINPNIKTTPSNKSSKNYDPNKHCGVVVETFDPLTNQLTSKEPCTRSLSCKKHSINSRRAVTGRYKTFNELFNEYRDEKCHQTDDLNVNNEQQLNKSRTKTNRKKQHQSETNEPIQLELETNNVTNDFNNQSELSQIQLNNDYNHLTQANNTNPSTLNTKFNTNMKQIPATFLPPPGELNSTNLNENLIKLNLNFSNSMLAKHHPRPSAVTSFNARLTDSGGGYTLWNRKQDNLRLILSNAFSQTSNYLDKNRCFTTASTDIILLKA